MTKRKHRRNRRKPFPVLPVVTGLLLLTLGILLMASPKTANSGAKDERSSSSVVPFPVSYAAPQLALQNITGATESLADYRRKVVLVNNWATWCPPCKAEMPTLVAYHNEHAADGFTVIAVEAGGPLELVSQFAQSYAMTFPVWLDPDGASLKAFGNDSLPNSYVIDRSGTVRYAWTGEINKAMLEQYVTPLIVENNQQ
jgi:peroxiredoxin